MVLRVWFQRLTLGLVLCSVLGLLAACGDRDAGADPGQTLVTFLTAVERSAQEPAFREQAYGWLDRGSQAELQRRAALARSLAGRELKPWEMLVPGRLTLNTRSLRNRPFDVSVDGDIADVSLGGAGQGDSVRLVREDGRWRVQLFAP